MALSLAINGLDAGYGAVKALRGVSLACRGRRDRGAARHQRQRQEHADEMHHGPGAPAAAAASSLTIDGNAHDLTRLPAEAIVDLGVALVPEGRRLFPKLTVEENLMLGAFRKAARRDIDRNLALRLRDVSDAEGAAAASSPAPCRAGSSRCWRSRAR